MALYALKQTSTGTVLKVSNFTGTPPVLPAAKDRQWHPYTPTPPVKTPEQLAREAAYAKLQQDKTAVLAYNKLETLSEMTPAQIQAWVDANVTNLATAQDAIKTLAIGLSVLIREKRLFNV